MQDTFYYFETYTRALFYTCKNFFSVIEGILATVNRNPSPSVNTNLISEARCRAIEANRERAGRRDTAGARGRGDAD